MTLTAGLRVLRTPMTDLRVTLPVVWGFSLANGVLCSLIDWLIWPRPQEPDR